MSIKFNTSGRPFIECINPECRKLHAIYRRGDYVKRAQTRIVCRSCGTKWNLKDEDQKLLQDHYEQRQQELEEKKKQKEQNNHQKQENKQVQQRQQVKTTKQQQTEKQVKTKKDKRGWLDELLS